MIKTRYEFTRGKGMPGFSSTNRASTDALNALQQWVAKPNRTYEVHQDEDDSLIADL